MVALLSMAAKYEEILLPNEAETSWWQLAPVRKTFPEPHVVYPQTLDELLLDNSFTDYGRLHKYKAFYDEGVEPYAYTAIKLLGKIQSNTLQLNPTDQASLVIRYIAAKTPGQTSYLSDTYGIPAITCELALGGFTHGTDKHKAWEKIMRADKLREERQTRRQNIRSV